MYEQFTVVIILLLASRVMGWWSTAYRTWLGLRPQQIKSASGSGLGAGLGFGAADWAGNAGPAHSDRGRYR